MTSEPETFSRTSRGPANKTNTRPQPLIAKTGASGSPTAGLPKRPLLRLVLFGLVALTLLAGVVGSGASRNTLAGASFTECVACFAAPIANTDAGPANVSLPPLASYGNVVLNQPSTWDARSNQNVQEALSLLPADVRSQLGNPALGPVRISVNDQGRTIDGSQPYGQAANFFSTAGNENEVVLYPDQSARTILHELGHAYNLRHTPGGSYGQAYLDPEMQDFIKATSWHVLTPSNQLSSIRDQSQVAVSLDGPSPWTNLSRNDPLEDFANSFALFFAAPSELQQLSPARYEWFAGHFAS